MSNGISSKVGIVSLGCPKNLVDSEIMLGRLKDAGFRIVDEAEDADVLIINTCTFIEDAKKESLDVIFQAVELKEEGRIKAIVVAGCLVQRYKDELAKELDQIDAFVGTGEVEGIKEVVDEVLAGKRVCRIGAAGWLNGGDAPRYPLTPPHFAYVKLAEGCRNRCSYCIIPETRGDYQSRRHEDIVTEVERLAQQGVKEVNLIAQDTTFYGMDKGRPQLATLLKDLVKIEGIRWLRLLYTHPAHWTDELIDVIKNEGRICRYIDLPIQHINDSILQAMGRKVTRDEIISLIKKLRRNIPGVALRTSIIVGFPGEGEREFIELVDFIKEVRFEHLGVFIYSREEGTPAARFSHQVPLHIKEERLDEVMRIQQEICLERNEGLLGKRMEVLIDEELGDTLLGRRECDAPEVDGAVFLDSRVAGIGDFKEIKVLDTLEYDLIGEVVDEPSQ